MVAEHGDQIAWAVSLGVLVLSHGSNFGSCLLNAILQVLNFSMATQHKKSVGNFAELNLSQKLCLTYWFGYLGQFENLGGKLH